MIFADIVPFNGCLIVKSPVGAFNKGEGTGLLRTHWEGLLTALLLTCRQGGAGVGVDRGPRGVVCGDPHRVPRAGLQVVDGEHLLGVGADNHIVGHQVPGPSVP